MKNISKVVLIALAATASLTTYASAFDIHVENQDAERSCLALIKINPLNKDGTVILKTLSGCNTAILTQGGGNLQCQYDKEDQYGAKITFTSPSGAEKPTIVNLKYDKNTGTGKASVTQTGAFIPHPTQTAPWDTFSTNSMEINMQHDGTPCK